MTHNIRIYGSPLDIIIHRVRRYGNRMEEKMFHQYVLWVGLMSILLLSDCSGYGRLSLVSGHGKDPIMVEKLVENSGDYVVHYSGYAVNNPSGIMFDPKTDDRTLVPSERWIKIKNSETVSEVVDWIKIHDYPWYDPKLYQIIGPNKDLYGYLFTGWQHVKLEAMENGKLFVYDLRSPPQYYGPSHEIKED